MHLQLLIAFGLYFTVLLTIGLLSHKKNATEADFVIGGRSLNYWVTAISAQASDMSSWLFMAFPMAIYMNGLPAAWLAVGLMLGMFVSWKFVAPKLRIETEKYDCYTLASFFERRFHDRSGTLRIVSAVMTLVFMLHYLSAGLTSMGFVFESLFGIDYYIGITIAIVVISIYTFVGGFITVAWTDLCQGIFLLFAIMLVPLVTFNKFGGWQTIQSAATNRGIALTMFPEMSLTTIIDLLFLMLMWGLGYFGQPHILSKFMGIKDPKELGKSMRLGLSWQFLALSSAALVGVIAIGYFPIPPANPELVFVEMVREQFQPLLVGLILCGVLAATISTMDSQILVVTGVLTEDVYRILFNQRRLDQGGSLINVSRFSVLLTALAVYLISLDGSRTIMDTVTYSWTGLGCSFGPLVVASLYLKNINLYGAVAGIVSGGLVASSWHLINPYLLNYSIPSMIPGFAFALLMIWLVSKLYQNKDKNRLNRINQV